MARIFLLSNFVASHDFSPNALKHIVCENQAGSWEQDENAKNARGVWFSYQFGTLWASSSRTGFCKNLLLALVFSLFPDSQGLFWRLLLWSGPWKGTRFELEKCIKWLHRVRFRWFFDPQKCIILLLALVFSLIIDRQKSTFFINFCLKIRSGASVAVGHPLQVLCFLYFGEPFLARWIFAQFSFFFSPNKDLL